ncbi:hypothetical protein Cpar_0941 [Chlorobaculum parvum NCIB 8327]|uniref:Uncharacterized protein n=1 Tax=Chlorobaculum parvum (strain DSM 263 / NCIMB 8327) TaxID=517417 RepID=B3QN48_CHLP8|nr:hypothetical protein [Chlorobaculum parvum]ACF11351.1 hypothetical protein Cpar_0941 [Chlorobaculum parvum NCIB 8327]
MAKTPVKQIYLIQNSGWMLPFYEDRSSKFKELGIVIAERIAKYGQTDQVVASFNQSIQDNKSPKMVYHGSDQNKVNAAIQSIMPVRKPGKTTYADTDFKEAIVGAITQYSAGQPCILWIITNNKNSPDNSPETIEKNKEFYAFLQNSDQIKRIVAFPYQMAVKGVTGNYTANGLMIYAMAYGDDADQLLQKMLKGNVPFGARVARLKPLNADAVTFMPLRVQGGKGVKASIVGNKTLMLSFNAARRPEAARIIGQLRNDFYPYDIQSAKVAISSGLNHDNNGIETKNDVIDKLAIKAGDVSPQLTVTISVPPIPSIWSPNVIFKSGYTTTGKIKFEVSDQKLAISKGFIKQMSELFPGDPLPDIFSPGESSRNSLTEQSVLVKVFYPSWPLFVFGGIIFIALGGAVFGMMMLQGETVYKVSVDGVQKNFALKMFHEQVINDANGKRVGMLKRGIGQPQIIKDKDANCTIRLM